MPRVGFRDLFIRTKNQIDYSLFRTSRKVYVGKDGWLFDRDAVDPLGQLTPAQMTAFEQSFVTLAEMLAHRGIRLVVVGHPDKVRVYPEMAPPNMPLPLPNDNVSKLRHFLASQPSLIFVDAEAILRKEKSRTSEHLFAKTDLHDTEAGALPVVMEIIARIAQAEGREGHREVAGVGLRGVPEVASGGAVGREKSHGDRAPEVGAARRTVARSQHVSGDPAALERFR